MSEEYISSTNYFNMPRTWIIRSLRFMLAVVVLYLVDLQELEHSSGILTGGYIFMGLLAVFFLICPTDELALDKDNLYFVRKSIVPFFNRSKKYKVADFKRVGSYNISKPAGIFALLVPVFNFHRVEIILKDDSSTSEDLIIYKKDLKKILLEVKGLI
jgi:hypothetical protein